VDNLKNDKGWLSSSQPYRVSGSRR
jgi:hypothetical protein